MAEQNIRTFRIKPEPRRITERKIFGCYPSGYRQKKNSIFFVPDLTHPHNLRHLFARCFYAVSKDIAKLADILGHSSINTTRLYIITTGEEHQRQLDALELVI